MFVPVFILGATGVLFAYPPFAIDHGNSCSVCHGTAPEDGGLDGGGEVRLDAMSVLSDLTFDPDESAGSPPADWTDRGELKMFLAKPGETVNLTMQVESGTVEYAVQLKRLEKEGFSGTGNRLAGHFSPDPEWTAQGTGETTYFTNSTDDFDGHDFPRGDIVPFTFSLALAEDTPHDLYDLEFAVAGRDGAAMFGKWYADEHFYVQVVPEPTAKTLIALVVLSLGILTSPIRRTG